MAATLERFSLYSKCGIIVHRRFYCEVLLANFAAENRTARRTYATLSLLSTPQHIVAFRLFTTICRVEHPGGKPAMPISCGKWCYRPQYVV